MLLNLRIWLLQEKLDKLYRTRCFYRLKGYDTSDISAHQIEYGMLQYDIDVAEDKLKNLLAKLKFKTDNSGR